MSTPKHHSNLVGVANTTNTTLSLGEDEGRTKAMFYSQCFLSSKSHLANIWLAGYFIKRLKKRQVTDTDIPSSVDKILIEGLPSVTYRILAYLLLGVVRIYSKKVEYLYQDCGRTVSDVNRYSIGKRPVPFRDVVRSSHSISLPERYELDAFQLEVADGESRDPTARAVDIVIQDVAKQYSIYQHCVEEASLQWDEADNAETSSGVTLQHQTRPPTQTPEKLASDPETSTLAHTPPDNVLSSPHRMGVDMEVNHTKCTKNLETSKEKLRGLQFTQDESMDIDMICEVDVELINMINNMQEVDTVDGNEDDLLMVPSENHELVVQGDLKVPSPIEEIHGPEVAELAAATTPVLKTPVLKILPTPAKKGKLQRRRKRKCIFDEKTMLDNEAMKHSIDDARDLVCKRRKVPHTVIDIWRNLRIPILTKIFKEPLIHCAAMEFEYILHVKKTELLPSLNSAAEPAGMSQVPEKLQIPVPPRTPPDTHMQIAPETPVRFSTFARVFQSPWATDSDAEGVHSFQYMRNDSFVHDEVHSPRLMDEMDTNEGDSQEIHKNKNGWSGRTRTVATYLHEVHQKQQQQQQQGEEVVPLLPILKSKTKGESARFFYEVLVLSSGGFIDVTQPKAYEDVLLKETSKMKATLQNC